MTTAPRVLLVEDDRAIREALESSLGQHGYEVAAAGDATEAKWALRQFHPDLALVDISLPGEENGFDVARAIRSQKDIALIYLTASVSAEDTLAAFELGADDYIKKPFSTPELLARIGAVLRRSGRMVSRTVRVRDLVIDEEAGAVWRQGERLDLTPIEVHLLARLARTPGHVVSKTQLLADVWGFDAFSPNLVEVHVSSLRRKLEANGPRLLFTERGAGYVVRP